MTWTMWAVIVGALLLVWYLGEYAGRRREAARQAKFQGGSYGPPTHDHDPPVKARFWCPECGAGVGVDEDGCCRVCGRDTSVVTPYPRG